MLSTRLSHHPFEFPAKSEWLADLLKSTRRCLPHCGGVAGFASGDGVEEGAGAGRYPGAFGVPGDVDAEGAGPGVPVEEGAGLR